MAIVWRRPAPGLRRWLGAYCGYRSEPAPRSVHHGVPSGHLTFLICVDGRIEMVRNADPARPPGAFTALVAGLHDAPAQIASGAAQTGLQLRLTWRGTRALFGLPAGELAGDTVDLAALLGRRTGPLLERLAEPGTWEERFTRLDVALTALARAEHGIRPEVGYAWDRLTATGGTLRIADLAREVGWSRRHLAAQLRRETGLAPKSAARVIRFERACDQLRFTDDPLATVAADRGYVDQSHLSRDFRDLAGRTVSAWRAEATSRPAGGATAAARPARRG